MTPAELRSAVITLLNGGNAWCKGAGARDANGLPCPPRSPNAVEWDLTGAIIKAFEGETDYTSYHVVLKELADNIPTSFKSRDLDAWNDSIEWDDLTSAMEHIALKASFGSGEHLSNFNLSDAE